MHIPIGIKTLKLWLDSKRGDLPGWTYVIALIIGIVILLGAVYIAWKAGQKETGIFEEIFG